MDQQAITIKYNPWSKQQEFHRKQTKFKAFIGGLGSGKSVSGAVEAIMADINYPGHLQVIVAPTYKMLQDSTIRTFFEYCPRELIEKYNRTDHHLTLVNSTEVLFRSGDNYDQIDRLRNINVGSFWLDEAGLFPKYIWDILVGRLRHPLGPRTGWTTTTPKGFNWLWEKFVHNPTEDYSYVTACSLDNPYLPEDYKKSLLAEYSGPFLRQEVYGLFVGFEGCVYSEFRRDVHVIDTKGMTFEAVIAGVDFGFTNPSVILKIGIDNDGRVYVLDEFYERHVTDADLADYAKKHYSDVEFFIADSENPSAIQEFQNRDLDCRGVKKSVSEAKENFVTSGIKRISNLLTVRGDGKPRLYVDRRCVNTIMEFENYRYPEKSEGKTEKEAPLKVFDHALDALRYVITTIGEEMDRIIFLEGEKK